MTATSNTTSVMAIATAPEWMHRLMDFRQRLFLRTVEPIIVSLLGPVEEEHLYTNHEAYLYSSQASYSYLDASHRRLSFTIPTYMKNVKAYNETSMSFATLAMLFVTLSCVFLIFLSCFYHNQKTSPLFISPRRHRLPKLVPPPLPVDGYFSWVKICLFISDEEIIQRIGYDALIFLRFHRLALRCIVKMSVFSCIVLLPLNFTGGEHDNAQGLKEYVGALFFTDFLRFTMANIKRSSPRLWVHCFAAYLLTAIVCYELVKEYELFNSIRHRYLLSREPHLRTVLVTNIPRHLRSASKLSSYFRHVYTNAVKDVFVCQNCLLLEEYIARRTVVLSRMEKELLVLCRTEKKKLYQQRFWKQLLSIKTKMEDCGVMEASQERMAKSYAELEVLNECVEQEQRRRRRVMKMLDRIEAGEGADDIDYVLASPFVMDSDPMQRRILGLEPSQNEYAPPKAGTEASQLESLPECNEEEVSGDRLSTDIPHWRLEETQLRSRSPAQPKVATQSTIQGDGLMRGGTYNGSHRRRLKPFAKARHVLRNYARLNPENSFLRRPLQQPATDANGDRIEEHINEVTDKAFVVMRTFTAATIAIQSMHSSKPGAMQVATAPEPRDVLWKNIYISKGAHRTRTILGETLVLLLIGLYMFPVGLVCFLLSENALIASSPRLAQLDQASAFFSAIIALIQPLCIVGLQQLLPPLFMMIGTAEGMLSFSEVQMRAFSRYFMFQVVNVFLATTIYGSMFDTIAIIIESPEMAFEMLGNSLPRMSSFFISFVTVKTFLALGFELVRTMSLFQATMRYIMVPNPTLRQLRTVFLGMRAIDDPGWFPFHKILAQDMLVVVISVVFAVVAPLVLFPCALFCFFSRIMWTHHHLYVYEGVFESGGQFWPKIFRRFVFGLVIAQMTITGQFILKGARHEAYATIALMFLTYFFLRSTRARYDPTSSTLPLEVATIMDIALQEEEQEAARRGQSIHDPGSRIGEFDPFHKAYLQPALRANPRARPEQPFPAAQLGREDGVGILPRDEAIRRVDQESTTDDDDGGWQDASATVHLKGLNQQDRRLINRWWQDQLQCAGPQDLLSVLTGERCGTLKIRGAHDVGAYNNTTNEYEFGRGDSLDGLSDSVTGTTGLV
ncbi:hypothetical protein MPSEU_001065100 [Mayamaea pseudoterrestris]|nr:hypothetical protein MPSEU_001065100 [Mayamaea pseudoterrestris]